MHKLKLIGYRKYFPRSRAFSLIIHGYTPINIAYTHGHRVVASACAFLVFLAYMPITRAHIRWKIITKMNYDVKRPVVLRGLKVKGAWSDFSEWRFLFK